MAKVCIDASLVILWLVPQKLSEQAEAQWVSWRNNKVDLIAPPFIMAEVTTALRKRVFYKQISRESGEKLFKNFFDLDFTIIYSDALYREAWELAKRFNLPKVYDMNYVALAKLEGCELWTGDHRLVNAVKSEFEWAKYVGDYVL